MLPKGPPGLEREEGAHPYFPSLVVVEVGLMPTAHLPLFLKCVPSLHLKLQTFYTSTVGEELRVMLLVFGFLIGR